MRTGGEIAGTAKPTRLEMCGRQRDCRDGTECVRIALRVPIELRWLEGHFPEDPILPAVVQVHEALRFVRESWPDLPGLVRIKRVKFRRPIRPLHALTLQLGRKDRSPRVTFEYSRDGEVYSTGNLEFGPRTAQDGE